RVKITDAIHEFTLYQQSLDMTYKNRALKLTAFARLAGPVEIDDISPETVRRFLDAGRPLFTDTPPRKGAEAAANMDFELSRFMHVYALNRNILLTPFHNMALMSPATTQADIDQHTHAFRDALQDLTA
ncbi:MAG: hypothetical protein WB660_19775, partial [Candidatus Sulfotelmatobacter sp.]